MLKIHQKIGKRHIPKLKHYQNNINYKLKSEDRLEITAIFPQILDKGFLSMQLICS